MILRLATANEKYAQILASNLRVIRGSDGSSWHGRLGHDQVRARQKIRCAFWRERRAGRCKAPRRRRCGDIVEERQRRRCPPAAAPLRAAARRPAGCVARSLHTTAVTAGMLVARALPAGLGASSKMHTLFPDGPLV